MSKILGISLGTIVGVTVLAVGGFWLWKNGCSKGISFICTLNQKKQAAAPTPHNPTNRILQQHQNAIAHAQAKKSVVGNTVSRLAGAYDSPSWAMAN